MTDGRRALRDHLRLAIEAYGEDQPVPESSTTGSGPEVVASPALAAVPATPPAPAPPAADPAPADPVAALAALRAIALACRKCALCETRTNVVFGEGSARARVMFIGEAPGQTEDETGRPFVGKAGQLLTRIVENAMGLARADVYIANVNKCRPPGNREPQPDEVAACLPFLRDQVRAVRPAVIVTLGKVATWNLLGVTDPMKRLRGRALEYDGIPVVATWHPAYLLRNPAAKADTWEDVKRVNRLLGAPDVPTPFRRQNP
jgi:DNA polymerase